MDGMVEDKEYPDLDAYQKTARDTAIYPHIGSNLIYTVLGLAGEAGELANKVKKLIRDYNIKMGDTIYDMFGKVNDAPTKKLRDDGMKILDSLPGELGGILWYTAMSSYEIAYPFGLIARDNLRELALRKAKDKIHGSGDARGLEGQ